MVPAGIILADLVILLVAMRVWTAKPGTTVAHRDMRIWIMSPALFALVTLIGFGFDTQDTLDWVLLPLGALALLLNAPLTFVFLRHLVAYPPWILHASFIAAGLGLPLFLLFDAHAGVMAGLVGGLAVAPYLLGLPILASRARSGQGVAAMRQRYGAMTTMASVILIVGAAFWLVPATANAGRFVLEGGLLFQAFAISMATVPPRRFLGMWRADAVLAFQRRIAQRDCLYFHDVPDLLEGLLDTGQVEVLPEGSPRQVQRVVGGTRGAIGDVRGELHVVGLACGATLAVAYPRVRVYPDEDVETLADMARSLDARWRDDEANRIIAEDLERTKELEAIKSDFLQSLGHELGNPLSPMRLQAKILRAKVPEEAAGGLDVMERNIRRLTALVENLKDVGRLQDAALELKKDRLDAIQIVEDVVEGMRPLAHEKSLAINTYYHGPAELDGDEGRIMQVVGNVVSNAIKYTEEGVIEVEVLAGNDVVVRVSDTGLGLSQDQLAVIGQAYERFHRNQGIEGTGLGMFVSRRIVEAHGGTLEVASEGPGKGCTVTMTFPAIRREDAPEPVLRQR